MFNLLSFIRYTNYTILCDSWMLISKPTTKFTTRDLYFSEKSEIRKYVFRFLQQYGDVGVLHVYVHMCKNIGIPTMYSRMYVQLQCNQIFDIYLGYEESTTPNGFWLSSFFLQLVLV